MIGRLIRWWKEFHQAGELIRAGRAEEKRILDDVHQKLQSGQLTGDQLDSVSLCCETLTSNLKGAGKLRGGGK